MNERFDYILAGGGAAGLSLAYHMMHRGLDDKRIAIIDKDEKTRNDRTWCFWIDRPFIFDPIVHRRWRNIWFHGPERSHRFALQPYEYRMIRGEDFYRYTRDDLSRRENVVFIQDNVVSLDDGEDEASVLLESGKTLTAEFIFDSLFLPRKFVVDTDRFRFLKQHFRGWVIETEDPVFDKDAATIFDLRIDQNGAFRFMYLLPFSETRSLVEYTFFSTDLLTPDEYEEGLRSYIEERLGIRSYKIVEEEDGIIPMSDQPFPRKGGKRILRIGTKGGRVKPSTGFAFLRTNIDSEQIVRSLIQRGDPFSIPQPPRRYATYDAMLLSILDRLPDKGRAIFVDLFEKNSITRLFRFLDEDGGLLENIQLMATVPWLTFVAAWFEVRLRRFRTPSRGLDR